MNTDKHRWKKVQNLKSRTEFTAEARRTVRKPNAMQVRVELSLGQAASKSEKQIPHPAALRQAQAGGDSLRMRSGQAG